MTQLNKTQMIALTSMEKGREYDLGEIQGDRPTVMSLEKEKRIECVNRGDSHQATPDLEHLRFRRV